MLCFFFFVPCRVSRPLIHLFLQMVKYVLPYKCNCITISNTFNFLTLKNRPIRWRTLYFSQLFNVHGVKDVGQADIHIAEPLVPEPSASEAELATYKLKSHKSPGTDQIPAELIKAGVE